MRHDELAHYGVRGMKWRFKKGITVDPSNSNVRIKRPNSNVRVEREKNISMTGPNHRLRTSERDVENKSEKDEFSKMANEAAEKDRKDREARKQAARDAYDEALRLAKERAGKSGGSGGSGGSGSYKADDKPSESLSSKPAAKDNKGSNEKNAYYTRNAREIESQYGMNPHVNVMNDVGKDPDKKKILNEMNKRTYKKR